MVPGLLLPHVFLEDVHLDEETPRGLVPLKPFLEGVVGYLKVTFFLIIVLC
jgi:hypothetical protein